MSHKTSRDAAVAPPSARPAVGRRGLVLGVGVAGAAAVATQVVRHAGTEPVAAKKAAGASSDEAQGYRLSAHVQRYYETTKA